MWAVIGGILLAFVALRALKPKPTQKLALSTADKTEEYAPESAYTRGWAATQASFRKYLLPESFVKVFGHVSRLQLLILAVLLVYLLAFS